MNQTVLLIIFICTSFFILAPIIEADSTRSGGWLMWGGNETRSGQTISHLTVPLSIRWKFSSGEAENDYYIGSSPAVSNNLVFVGSTDNALRALDLIDGVERWRFKTEGPIYSSPSVSEGRVYFGSDDGRLYVVDETTGNLSWSFDTGGRVRSSPLVIDGIVYFGSSDHIVYAVNAETGTLEWKYVTRDAVISSPAISSDGLILIGSDDGNLYALDSATGVLAWKFFIGNRIWSYVAVVEDTAYVGSYTNSLYAVDTRHGDLKWSVETGYYIRSSAAIAHGLVIIGSTDGSYRAVKASNGAVIWRFRTGSGIVTNAPVVSGELVFLTSPDRSIYALDLESGGLLWRTNVTASIISTPAISNETLFIQSSDNSVYAYSPVASDIIFTQLYPSESLQFITIYNAAKDDRDLSGWLISNGEEKFRIPDGTFLEHGAALVLASDRAAYSSTFDSHPDLVWSNMTLESVYGEVKLINRSGDIVDTVRYGSGRPDEVYLHSGDSLMRRMGQDGEYIKTMIPKIDYYSVNPMVVKEVAGEPFYATQLGVLILLALVILVSTFVLIGIKRRNQVLRND